jgi:hypothetical protein
MAGTLCRVNDVFQAEATALAYAIQAADQLGVGRVVFETDCLNLKNAMTTTTYDSSPLGVLFMDMKFQLSMCFIDSQVVYTPRGCNKPAHELAAWGVSVALEDHLLWTMSYPSFVTRLLTSDLAVF